MTRFGVLIVGFVRADAMATERLVMFVGCKHDTGHDG